MKLPPTLTHALQRMLLLHLLAGLLFVVPCISTSTASESTDSHAKSKPVLERELPHFRLTGYRGREYTPADFEQADILVIAFLGVECPLAKLYTERLEAMYSEIDGDRVALLGVDANLQDSLEELAAHARQYNISFPLVKDGKQSLAKALGASRTPEVFVLDRERRVRYYGRIDDQYGIGYVRDEPTTTDLRNAVVALLEDRPVPTSHQAAVGCRIGWAKEPNPNAEITYSNQIARIFQRRCVTCHREGEIGPFAMTDYDEISGWAEMILEVVEQRRMPPWYASPEYGEFANDCSLEAEEIEQIRQWVADGAPEGDPSLLPEPTEYIEGWRLPREPDMVVNVSPEPVKVPADGEVEYKYFVVDFEADQDRWLQAAQFVPGNRPVVHHILAFARPKGSRGGLGGQRSFLVGYVPGSFAMNYPQGMAKKIPAGSELVFQVHYTPIGREVLDHSKLGLVFADSDSVKYEVKTTSAVQPRLAIPPHEPNYKTSAMLPEKLPECQLLALAPHMHLRGKSFRYTVIYPSGEREIVLDVPEYDFNWQTAYRLADPLDLPAGTRIYCEATFDNSADNWNNPNPNQTVRWGDQTDDEMMIGYFDIIVSRESRQEDLNLQSRRQKLIRQIVERGLFSRLDKDHDNRIARNEIPARLMQRFELLDRNRDGAITPDELQ